MPTDNSNETPLLRDQLCFALYATSRAFTKLYASLLEELGVTYPQYLVLLVLWEKGPLPILQIAGELEIEGATATPLIKRMESLGLVSRDRSAKDERRVVVSLTENGENLRKKSCVIPEQLGCAAGIDEKQAQKLLHEINAIRGSVSKFTR